MEVLESLQGSRQVLDFHPFVGRAGLRVDRYTNHLEAYPSFNVSKGSILSGCLSCIGLWLGLEA